MDRRAAIAAAFQEHEVEDTGNGTTGQEAAPTPPAPPAPAPQTSVVPLKPPATATAGVEHTAPPTGAPPASPAAPKEPEGTEEDGQQQKTYNVEKPPQSWRPAQRAKWATLDPDVRQEVIRRERDVEKTLSQSAGARQLQNALVQAVNPYMARVNELGMHPIQVIQEFFKIDHSLRTGGASSRAQAMAKLIKQYDIDVAALDEALVGGQPSKSAEEDRLERLLQERLNPFMKFIEEQTQENKAQREADMASLEKQIEAMSEDTEKYPEFANVYADMADLIEIQAKRGVYLTLDQAYTRAVAMNPEASERVRALTDKANKDQSVRQANERAQRALAASKSVTGAPNGVPSGTIDRKDRRATIAAAFDAAQGR